MRDDLVTKATEVLEPFREANEESNAFVILAADREGVTISVQGCESSIVKAIAFSMLKKDDFGQIIDKANKLNMHAMLDLLFDLDKRTNKDQTNE